MPKSSNAFLSSIWLAAVSKASKLASKSKSTSNPPIVQTPSNLKSDAKAFANLKVASVSPAANVIGVTSTTFPSLSITSIVTSSVSTSRPAANTTSTPSALIAQNHLF